MNTSLPFDFTVDKQNNTVLVQREFAAARNLVWDAWTKPEILDQWWAPKPYRTETLSMDFTPGGSWRYCMVGPEGEKHWCRADYKEVSPRERYSALDAFTDEAGHINAAFPRALWTNSFSAKGDNTVVNIVIRYDSLADLETIIGLGFQEGFGMAMGNLDQYLEAAGRLRNDLRRDNRARVTTYLNFPGNTEAAFTFYRSVFKTEFNGDGIVRFGSLPEQPGQPPVADSVKQMVLHVELPITGGHVLMATDAPKEMGFTVEKGNNMHISIEPESREEAERIFHALSEGGTISMPLQDMFWGAYFGSFTDRFGINWMVNCKKE